jgi:tetratricopeptide (TPR) repeat protein
MADANLNVSEALQDAQKAVTEEETETAKISIDHADPQDYATATRLAAYWDTLGWAYFRTGDLDKAEKYLNAGWHLSQDPTIADHLGQLYEKEGKKAAARQTYEAAVATGHAPQHALDRLNEIGGGGGVDVMPQAIQNLRIVQVPISPKPKLHVSADFVVLLSPDKVEARYVSGSGLLQAAEKALDATKFAFPFPDSGPVKTLRRGILDCEPELRRCSFAMYPLAYPQQLTPTRTRPENIRGATVLKLKTRHPPVVVKHSGDAGHNSGGSPQ